jgi:hypothetical protein
MFPIGPIGIFSAGVSHTTSKSWISLRYFLIVQIKLSLKVYANPSFSKKGLVSGRQISRTVLGKYFSS